jgi:glyoxalase family protein
VRGSGETNAVAYNVPTGSLGFWQTHLQQHGVDLEPIEKRFGEQVLSFQDPDGMRLELVESASAAPVRFWEEGPIPQSRALLGFHSVTLWVGRLEPTANLLTQHMGYNAQGQEGQRHRFVGDSGASGHIVDLVYRPGDRRAEFGVGSIHHIAFRTPTDAMQLEYQNALRQAGFRVTDVMDRNYFHSIYYRERAGVLFEIATDTPGFAIDEPVQTLGESLKLPAWYESNRTTIEQSLLPITLKSFEKVPA